MAAPAAPTAPAPTRPAASLRAMRSDLLLSEGRRRLRRASGAMGQSLLLAITSSSAIAVLFIFYFIFRDALPFFRLEGLTEFLGSTRWYPSSSPAEFGALAIFVGSLLVTLGAIAVAMPLGVSGPRRCPMIRPARAGPPASCRRRARRRGRRPASPTPWLRGQLPGPVTARLR